MWQVASEMGKNQMELQLADVGESSCALKVCFTLHCSDSALFEVSEDLSVTCHES